MRRSRLIVLAAAWVLALVIVPSSAFAYTLYGAGHETTRNAYGNYYAGQDRCTGALCHTDIVNSKTVHSSFITDIPATPEKLLPPAGDSAFWPTPFAGLKAWPQDVYLQVGDSIGFLEYVGAADTTLGVPNPADDLHMLSGMQYTIGASAWDAATTLTVSAYSQSCSGCHNLGVTRPSNATYTLKNGGTETTSTPSGAFGLGIQCEVCHGSGKNPGAHQPGIPGVVSGTQILKAQVCGQCHETATAAEKNVAGSSFGNANGYTTDATLSAFMSPTLTVPTEAQFMSYITSGGAKPAFLPNGDNYSLRHVYYNEWLNNLAPSGHGGSYGHANPTNTAVATGDPKCLGCHSGLGFLQRIETKNPLGSLLVTDAPTLAQVKAEDPGISCQVCHDGHVGYNAENTGYDSARKWGNGTAVSCGDCHNWQFEVLEQPVQSEIIAGKRYAREPLNTAAHHPQREMFTGGNGGPNGNAGMWGVAPMGVFMPDQKCQDCHMPRTSREGMPANDDGATEGTRMSHRFHVTMPGDAARYKLRKSGDSCSVIGCHKDSAADYTRADFQQWIDTVQAGTQRHVDEATSALSAASAGLGMTGNFKDFIQSQPATVTAPSPAEWKMLQKAAQNTDFVNSDSSKGVHQPKYSAAGLNVAVIWARSFDASITATKLPRIDGGDGVRVVGTLRGNDGAPLVGATVVLEASTDGGGSWTAAQSKHLSASAFSFNTGPVLGETRFRVAYSPDAGVAYRTNELIVDVPFTTIDLAPTAAATDWVDAPVRTTLNTLGSSAITMYSLSGATMQAPTVYYGPFWIAANGTTDITYWSTSDEGAEAPRVQHVRIDRTTPSVTSDASTLYLNDAVIHVTAHDTLSGPKYVEYSVDGGGWARVDGSAATVGVSSLGAHTLRARATNNLGHTGAERVWSFSIKRATAVSAYPSTLSVTIKHGSTWVYSAAVRTGDGSLLGGKTVLLQRSTNGVSWSTVVTRVTNGRGTASRSAKMSARGTSYWRWYVPGDAKYLAAIGPRIKLVVK